MGYLYHELGDFRGARGEYNRLIELDTSGPYGPAARLNLANMDAESGAVERARQEYDALLADNLGDTSARLSRALLELRQGQAERAYIDCASCSRGRRTEESRRGPGDSSPGALAPGPPRRGDRRRDKAQRARPGPAHERLRQRAILAARRFDLLQLDQPDELALLPLGGRRLTADLRAAAVRPRPARARPPRRDLPGIPHAGGDPGGPGPESNGGRRGDPGSPGFALLAHEAT